MSYNYLSLCSIVSYIETAKNQHEGFFTIHTGLEIILIRRQIGKVV